jgi:hypothetical protein
MNPTDNHTLVRAKWIKTDDSGAQQTAQLQGRHQEQFGGDNHLIHRLQSYPLSAPPTRRKIRRASSS